MLIFHNNPIQAYQNADAIVYIIIFQKNTFGKIWEMILKNMLKHIFNINKGDQ